MMGPEDETRCEQDQPAWPDDFTLRSAALNYAISSREPMDMTLRRARTYYEFLKGDAPEQPEVRHAA